MEVTLKEAVEALKRVQKTAPNMCFAGKGNGHIKFRDVTE